MVAEARGKIDWSVELVRLIRPITARLNPEAVEQVAQDLSVTLSIPAGVRKKEPQEVARALHVTLLRLLVQWHGAEEELYENIRRWRGLYYRATDEEERRSILEDTIRKRPDLWPEWGDKWKKSAPSEDWEAMEERLTIGRWALWVRQIVALEALEGLYRPIDANVDSLHSPSGSELAQNTIASLIDYLNREGQAQARRAAVRVILAILDLLPELQQRIYSRHGEELLSLLNNVEEDRWVRVALVDLMGRLGTEAVLTHLLPILRDGDESGDRYLLRAHAVHALADSDVPIKQVLKELTELADRPDASEYTRLACVEACDRLTAIGGLEILLQIAEAENARTDSVYTIRARLAETISRLLRQINAGDSQANEAVAYLGWWASRDTNDVVRMIAQQECARLVLDLEGENSEAVKVKLVQALVKRLVAREEAGETERIAGLLEEIRIGIDPVLTDLRDRIFSLAEKTDWGKRFQVALPEGVSAVEAVRIMASLTRTDAGLYATVKNGKLKVQRGERFRRKLWRLLHEFRHLRPNMRSDTVHTRGRVYGFAHRAHPERLAEVNPTTIPGERVLVERMGGWGRYLPLPDDCLEASKEVSLYSSCGITKVQQPKGVFSRLRARQRLNFDYEWYNRKRYDAMQQLERPKRIDYIEALRSRLGFSISFEPYRYELFGVEVDLDLPDVRSFFELEEQS